MIADPPLDLSPVYRHCVFRSQERAGTHAPVARELALHDLRWQRDAAGAVLYKARVRRIELFVLRYDADVQVWSQPFRDFVLVHMPLSAPLDISVDGTDVTVAPGRAALVRPLHGIRLDCRSGAERLIVKIPLALFREALGAAGPQAPGGLPPVFVLPAPQDAHWLRLLQSLVELSDDAAPSPARAAWADHLELNTALFLLAHRPPAGDPDGADAPGARRLATLQQHLQGRLGMPLTLADVARAAGTSPRSLNLLTQRQRGLTPMGLVRELRLEAVRARLMNEPGAGVTDSALAFGFTHLGRFAAQYRARFGELPHETLARHQPGLRTPLRKLS